jgi:small subunit ribosomal protein S18
MVFITKKRRSGLRRKKVCRFCVDKLDIDYKDVKSLHFYTSERGKIIPRRISGNCARHQRRLTSAVKRARNIALMPFIAE